MTDEDMYDLLCRKAQDIKLHIDACDMAEIAERFAYRVPQNPETITYGRGFHYLSCPKCGMLLTMVRMVGAVKLQNNFCPNCGQAIDWSDDDGTD